VKVTDEQVAALRARLSGNVDEHLQMMEQMGNPADRAGFTALTVAAFCDAAERRFGDGSTRAEVIEFVAGVRERSDRLAAKIDPRAAERMILSVYAGEDTSDIPKAARDNAVVLILPALIIDMGITGAELDQFLAGARKLADEWLK
jgi:hypothetical protein